MSEIIFKVGRRVHVPTKNTQGTIGYTGLTSFATGKWIGVILDEPSGKNDGVVQGRTYFQCKANHGIFLRESQLIPLDDDGKPMDVSNVSTDENLSGSFTEQPPKKPGRLTSSRMSLASSRQSLLGSKQSLLGSRTNLATGTNTPVSDKPSGIASASMATSTPDRASFVETGFLETLKPQFTPGQSLVSPIVQSPLYQQQHFNNQQQMQEIENLRTQVKDLSEKLETLRIKRQEDKEKLKDYDKVKLQIEQLLEFKTKIMESQTGLQRELQRAKQETREAIEAREKHAEEMMELAETVEMAALDREMAEEKAETLQLELETAKEKLEEMAVDLELLKAELQDKESGTVRDGAASSYEMKQLEVQNARLREALVRVRDLSAQDKHEMQKLQKDLDQKKSEIAELSRTKEKLSQRVEELEMQIVDLQENVDAALGAEEMVLTLGDAKMTLEDEVKRLREELNDLELIQDMNEQLVESNAELEQDLREELDLAYGKIREAIREKEAAFETIADREQTIIKFRELVQKQQAQQQQLQQRLESESSKPVAQFAEIIDFQKMFTETKAHTKAIDLELRKIEVQQCNEHIKYLTAYMPDTFMTRGGDNDAISVLLLMPRMLWKSDMLITRLRDKYPSVNKLDRHACVQEHAVEQYTFSCLLTYHLLYLQTILHKYFYALNACKPNALLKVGANFPEMLAQEKAVDNLLELLKQDQLDENISLEQIDRCVNYFSTMFPLLLSTATDDTGAQTPDKPEKPSGLLNHNLLLHDSMKALAIAFDGIATEATVIRTILPASNFGELGLLAQHIISTADQIQQQIKLIKRRLPHNTANVTNLGFHFDLSENLQVCFLNTSRVFKTLLEICKTAVHHISVSGDQDQSLTIAHDKLKDIAINASDHVYEQDDLGPVQSLKGSLTLVLTQCTQLAQVLQDNEHDINTRKFDENKPIPPIVLRAQNVKKEMEETKNLAIKLEKRNADIAELKKILKQKQEELSEMVIRKDLAEKKLGNVSKDYESYNETLQRKLEEKDQMLKRKIKEFEETMDHLQADIDALEEEKGEMKEKIKLLSKKAHMEANKANTSGPTSLNTSMTGTVSFPSVIKDSPLLMHEIKQLKRIVQSQSLELQQIHATNTRRQLARLTPLPKLRDANACDRERMNKLVAEANAVVQDYFMTLATPSMPSVANVDDLPAKLMKSIANDKLRLAAVKRRADCVVNDIAREAIKLKSLGMVESDFAVFPNKDMTKALNEIEAITVAEISIPINASNKSMLKPGVVSLEVTSEKLREIHQRLLSL